MRGKESCRVYIPNDRGAKVEAVILAHEIGHCNGWKHPYPPGQQPPGDMKPVEIK